MKDEAGCCQCLKGFSRQWWYLYAYTCSRVEEDESVEAGLLRCSRYGSLTGIETIWVKVNLSQ